MVHGDLISPKSLVKLSNNLLSSYKRWVHRVPTYIISRLKKSNNYLIVEGFTFNENAENELNWVLLLFTFCVYLLNISEHCEWIVGKCVGACNGEHWFNAYFIEVDAGREINCVVWEWAVSSCSIMFMHSTQLTCFHTFVKVESYIKIFCFLDTSSNCKMTKTVSLLKSAEFNVFFEKFLFLSVFNFLQLRWLQG